MSLIIIGFTFLINSDAIPYKFFHFWKIEGGLLEAIKHSWVIFLYGILINLWISTNRQQSHEELRTAEDLLLGGTMVSVWAGVVEEICFRWIIFYGVMCTLQLLNFFFFGWLGFGLLDFIYSWALVPVADFARFEYLQPQLKSEFGWFVGAAIISSNGRFREGHAYQGFRGYVASWFLGMFFFWIMFNYGLLEAIVVHFLYDFLIFFTVYLVLVVKRSS